MKNVLKYPGSKWSIAEWIIENFPESHHTYIEPYFGSGAVLFSKKQSAIETVNDLDDDVVNLFQCIKKDHERVAAMVRMTPYSRKEYDRAFESRKNDDEFEKAVTFLVKCWQGHGFRTNGYKVGWKNDVQGRENAYAAYNWYRLPGWIIGIVDRLKQVQIDCQPAIKFIQRHKNSKTLIYADPPYLLETRTAKQYKHEMTAEDHVELLETLKSHPGPVIISGYDSQLYNEQLKKWEKISTKGKREYKGSDVKEVIWINYQPPAQQISVIDILSKK